MATDCATGSQDWEKQDKLLQDKLMQGNNRKVWKCAAASSNIQLCLWQFPCCSAKMTAWYSSWNPSLFLHPPYTHTDTCTYCNSLWKSTPSTLQLEGSWPQCISSFICLLISFFSTLEACSIFPSADREGLHTIIYSADESDSLILTS